MRNIRHRNILKYHPKYGFTFRENIFVRVACQEKNNVKDRTSYFIRTNSAGFRCGREPLEDAAGKLKVLFIGCSFTAGDGVSNERRFTDLLEGMLGNVAVYNFGLSATGFDQQYLIHQDAQAAARPDVLVLSPYVGCIGRNTMPYRKSFDMFTGGMTRQPKPYFTMDGDGALALHNVPVPRLRMNPEPAGNIGSVELPFVKRAWSRGAGLARRTLKGLSGGLPPYLAKYDDEESLEYRLSARLLESAMNESGARIKALLPLPNMLYLERGFRPNYLPFFRRVAERCGAQLWDVYGKMAEQGKSGVEKMFLSHGHYSEAGHRVVASLTAEKLGNLLKS